MSVNYYDSANDTLISADGRQKTYMGTCATAAGTKDKEATVGSDFKLIKGVRVGIKFSNTNTYSSTTSNPITLDVNSTGAKNIYYNNTDSGNGNTGINARPYGTANRYNYYVYDGTYWVFDGSSMDNGINTPKEIGVGYATCSTAAATADKVATYADYVLTTGGYVSVKFTNDVPANATLKVGSAAKKNIFYHGSAITAGIIKGGDLATFIYDGTQYQLVGVDRDTSDIQTLTNNKVNVSDIANNLITTASGKVLDARQGKALKDSLSNKVNTSDIVNNITTTTPGKVLDASQAGVLYNMLYYRMAFRTQESGNTEFSSEDPNDIAVTSVYNITNNSNLPDLGWWYLFTLTHATNSAYRSQIAIKMSDSNVIYKREKTNTGWSNWSPFASNDTYITQTKEVTLTANADAWSTKTITWDVPFTKSPHISILPLGAANAPTSVSLFSYSNTALQIGMWDKNYDVSVKVFASGWIK